MMRWLVGAAWAGILLLAVAVFFHPSGPVLAADAVVKPRALEQPDATCAGCHREIYERYERTPMAQGSGLATDALATGGFRHAASGVDYRVFLRDGAGWMRFEQPPVAGEAEGRTGERQLLYFVGSGRRGRTYLYQVDGQWFELPINFYSRRGVWDMAPAFDAARTMPAALPTDANCLHCHATGVSEPMPTARNRYTGTPFTQGGVGCSACHGDPAAHLASRGHGPIVNPAKLSVSRRDSACLQCHLEGDAVVYRPGRSLAQFRAGDDLADDALYFVKASAATGGGRATSQYEALLRSACKRASGDKLTCTTCHDPHSSPTPEERVGFFRAKCLQCHTGAALAANHHPEQPDCAMCHMPSRKTTDISHEQTTDHNIERRPETVAAPRLLSLSAGEELVPVGGGAVGDRELGLAYAQMAQRGDRPAGERALRLLLKVQAAGAGDAQMHVQLGFLEQMAGQADRARAEYQAALRVDAYEPAALANLAVIDAGSGRLPEAVGLLTTLTAADPSQTAAGLNLAFIECSLGQKKEALALLDRLALLNPGDARLRLFRASGKYAGQVCSLGAEPVLR